MIGRAVRRGSGRCSTWLTLGTTRPLVHVAEGSFDVSAVAMHPVGQPEAVVSERPCASVAFQKRERYRQVLVDGVLLSGASARCVQHAVDVWRGVWGEGACVTQKEL